jgi:hypothetical protein
MVNYAMYSVGQICVVWRISTRLKCGTACNCFSEDLGYLVELLAKATYKDDIASCAKTEFATCLAAFITASPDFNSHLGNSSNMSTECRIR